MCRRSTIMTDWVCSWYIVVKSPMKYEIFEVLTSALLMAVIAVVVFTKGLRGYGGLVIGGIVGLDIFFFAFISDLEHRWTLHVHLPQLWSRGFWIIYGCIGVPHLSELPLLLCLLEKNLLAISNRSGFRLFSLSWWITISDYS